MIDSNFYEKNRTITLGGICKILSIDVPNSSFQDTEITGIAQLTEATESDVTFFHNIKYSEALSKTRAFACLISDKLSGLVPSNVLPLVVSDPYLALGILLREFYTIKSNHDYSRTFVSKNAFISDTASIGNGCYISDFASIGEKVIIGDGTYIGSNVTISRGVKIGKNSHIEPNSTISFAEIGDSAFIKSGSRIGQQGFGFHVGETGITDIMQIGKVIIGNNTQIGANCTIDRGSMNDTVIGNNVRIDNMVHVAHNTQIGDYCVIAAQTGIAGSVDIGKGCAIGGQVGIAGHIKIGNNVSIAAQSGLMQNVDDGSKLAGSPAVTAVSWHRQNILLKQLVENRRKTQIYQKKEDD